MSRGGPLHNRSVRMALTAVAIAAYPR